MSSQTSTLNFLLFWAAKVNCWLHLWKVNLYNLWNKIYVYDFSCLSRIYCGLSVQYTGFTFMHICFYALIHCSQHVVYIVHVQCALSQVVWSEQCTECIVHCTERGACNVQHAVCNVQSVVFIVQWVRYLASKAFVHDARIVEQHWRCQLKFVSEIIQSDGKNLSPIIILGYMDTGESN